MQGVASLSSAANAAPPHLPPVLVVVVVVLLRSTMDPGPPKSEEKQGYPDMRAPVPRQCSSVETAIISTSLVPETAAVVLCTRQDIVLRREAASDRTGAPIPWPGTSPARPFHRPACGMSVGVQWLKERRGRGCRCNLQLSGAVECDPVLRFCFRRPSPLIIGLGKPFRVRRGTARQRFHQDWNGLRNCGLHAT